MKRLCGEHAPYKIIFWDKVKQEWYMKEDKNNIIFHKFKCCNAEVKIEGRNTLYYSCLKCGKACDIR